MLSALGAPLLLVAQLCPCPCTAERRGDSPVAVLLEVSTVCSPAASMRSAQCCWSAHNGVIYDQDQGGFPLEGGSRGGLSHLAAPVEVGSPSPARRAAPARKRGARADGAGSTWECEVGAERSGPAPNTRRLFQLGPIFTGEAATLFWQRLLVNIGLNRKPDA